DIISANRKILEDIKFRVKKLEFGLLDPDGNAVSQGVKKENDIKKEDY
ncbi:MAG: glycosyltransferase family 2 protein, partial [Lachnospiraceae bacterium]|nr:glycosyltransferase family 2 protein [Lachnospiraceae bacterium]